MVAEAIAADVVPHQLNQALAAAAHSIIMSSVVCVNRTFFTETN